MTEFEQAFPGVLGSPDGRRIGAIWEQFDIAGEIDRRKPKPRLPLTALQLLFSADGARMEFRFNNEVGFYFRAKREIRRGQDLTKADIDMDSVEPVPVKGFHGHWTALRTDWQEYVVLNNMMLLASLKPWVAVRMFNYILGKKKVAFSRLSTDDKVVFTQSALAEEPFATRLGRMAWNIEKTIRNDIRFSNGDAAHVTDSLEAIEAEEAQGDRGGLIPRSAESRAYRKHQDKTQREEQGRESDEGYYKETLAAIMQEANLDLKEQAVIMLPYTKDWDDKEIADYFNRTLGETGTVGAVRSLRDRTMKKLRETNIVEGTRKNV